MRTTINHIFPAPIPKWSDLESIPNQEGFELEVLYKTGKIQRCRVVKSAKTRFHRLEANGASVVITRLNGWKRV